MIDYISLSPGSSISPILSCISTYISVELETKPYINIPPALIFILLCDFKKKFNLNFGKKITYLNNLSFLGKYLKYPSRSQI